MNTPRKIQLDRDVGADLGARERATLDYARGVQSWMDGPRAQLAHLAPTHSEGIHTWMMQTIQAGVEAFGIQCPTLIIVSMAAQHLDTDQDLTRAFCAIREAERQKDALTRIASRIAHDDIMWDGLMAPIMEVDLSGTAVIDAALLILMGEHFGNSANTYWRVAQTWHLEQFGSAPKVTRAEFDACVL